MPWRHMDAKSERVQFVRDARNDLMSFTELCALYQISRITGYKWVKRAEQSGLAFLDELSRRPHSCPHATPPALQARLIEARRPRAYFGVLLLLLTAGLTFPRAHASTSPLEALAIDTHMHADRRASALSLANAQHHAAHARLSFDARWSLAGYATHSLIGRALGLALIFVRRRTGGV